MTGAVRSLTAMATLLTLLAWSPGDAAPEPSPGPEAVVRIKHFEFTPASIVIPAGGAVRWVNEDLAAHQVTTGEVAGKHARPDGRVSSRQFFRSDAVVVAFVTAGEYPYHCGIHPFMRGTVTVR